MKWKDGFELKREKTHGQGGGGRESAKKGKKWKERKSQGANGLKLINPE